MRLELTKGYFAEVDEDFDPKGRLFCAAEQITSSNKLRVLAVGSMKNPQGKWRLVQLGYFVLGRTPWENPGLILDHENRDPLWNRRLNLRLVTHAVNSQNRKQRDEGVGVSFDKARGKFTAYRMRRGVTKNRQIHLGRYDTYEEARFAVIQSMQEA